MPVRDGNTVSTVGIGGTISSGMGAFPGMERERKAERERERGRGGREQGGERGGREEGEREGEERGERGRHSGCMVLHYCFEIAAKKSIS